MKKKYYFVSIVGNINGAKVHGHSLVAIKNKSLSEICELLKDKFNMDSAPVILCLKRLTENEYMMLSGRDAGNSERR